MRKSDLRMAVLFTLAIEGLGVPAAWAQSPAPPYVERRTQAGSEVWFPVDKLTGAEGGAQAMVVKGRPDAARMGLMRPRLQFVTEMLKSVEAL